MRRMVPILALLLFALPALADGFRDAKKAFQKAFDRPAPAEEREAAVRTLAAFDTKEAARLLVSGIPVSRKELDLLLVERVNVQTGRIQFPDGGPQPRLSELKSEIDREMKVLEALDDALAGRREKKTVLYLVRDALRDRNVFVRVSVAKALGRIGDAKAIPALEKALSDKADRVRGAAILSLGRLKAGAAVPDLIECLADDTWTIRAAACEALAEIGDLRAVIPLIDRLPAEQGRLAEDVAAALTKLTGQSFDTAVDAWQRWLAANRALIEAGGPLPKPPPKPPEKTAKDEDSYYGIPVRTRKAIFIIDMSQSMSYSAEADQALPKPGEDSRLDLAKRELKRALLRYPSKGRFTVIAFHNELDVWKPTMQDATKAKRDAATAWVIALKATGTTNIYAALERAFAIAGMGVTDRHYNVSADSIYLLSDGAPTNADLSDDDPARILRAVREWNRLGRVKVHTIGLRGHNAYFMSTLAEENDGTYVVR